MKQPVSVSSTRRLTVETPIHFATGRRSRREIFDGPSPAPTPPLGKVPRVARLMALAIHFDDLIRRREVRDYAEIARLGQLTRARATQIMALLNLAPHIQEALLFLPRVFEGRDPVTERDMRVVVSVGSWDQQRQIWNKAHRKS